MTDLAALAACILSDQVPHEDVPRLVDAHPGLAALLQRPPAPAKESEPCPA